MKTLLILIVSALLSLSSFLANAGIINIDAFNHRDTSPLSLRLDPGVYEVTPIGIKDGGKYDAWNAFGRNTGHVWYHTYLISSAAFPQIVKGEAIRYTSAQEALKNAQSASFTLSTSSIVNFFVYDNLYSDNFGGVSLRLNNTSSVANVSSPATLSLFSIFILLLGRLFWQKNEHKEFA